MKKVDFSFPLIVKCSPKAIPQKKKSREILAFMQQHQWATYWHLLGTHCGLETTAGLGDGTVNVTGGTGSITYLLSGMLHLVGAGR